MKKIILIILVLCISSISISQRNEVNLKIEKVRFSQDTIFITVEVKNDSTVGITIAKPDVSFTCFNLLNIHFEDCISGKKFDCLPCTDIYDFESLTINYINGIYLRNNESFKNTIKIDKTYTKYLKIHHEYYLSISYNAIGINFESTMKNIYHGRINSNRVLVKYE
jgi:hypothetical protein